MTPQSMNTEVSVIGTTGSAFLPWGGSHSGIFGLRITPVDLLNIRQPRAAAKFSFIIRGEANFS